MQICRSPVDDLPRHGLELTGPPADDVVDACSQRREEHQGQDARNLALVVAGETVAELGEAPAPLEGHWEVKPGTAGCGEKKKVKCEL